MYENRNNTHIRTFSESEALTAVKLLIENGYTVRIYQTDDTLEETIIEFWKGERGYNPYQD